MMKKIIISVFILVFSISVTLSFFLTSPKITESPTESQKLEKSNVITVTNKASHTPDKAKVLETRFLNMLNHSLVYNESFYSVDSLVNSSIPALLNLRYDDDSYIKEIYVADYLYNMYGIEIKDLSEINSEFGKKEGYIYIVPSGYENYSHNIMDVIKNDDGSYTVTTQVEISSHDGMVYVETCESMFIENPDSKFGYNILYSNFITDNINI